MATLRATFVAIIVLLSASHIFAATLTFTNVSEGSAVDSSEYGFLPPDMGTQHSLEAVSVPSGFPPPISGSYVTIAEQDSEPWAAFIQEVILPTNYVSEFGWLTVYSRGPAGFWWNNTFQGWTIDPATATPGRFTARTFTIPNALIQGGTNYAKIEASTLQNDVPAVVAFYTETEGDIVPPTGIPEPGSMALIGGGLIAFVAWHRNRSAKT